MPADVAVHWLRLGFLVAPRSISKGQRVRRPLELRVRGHPCVTPTVSDQDRGKDEGDSYCCPGRVERFAALAERRRNASQRGRDNDSYEDGIRQPAQNSDPPRPCTAVHNPGPDNERNEGKGNRSNSARREDHQQRKPDEEHPSR